MNRAIVAVLLLLSWSEAAFSQSEKPLMGVLFSSYGDVDHYSEAHELVINTLTDPDVVPLPGPVRQIVAQAGWLGKKDKIKSEYLAVGGATHLRAHGLGQAQLVAEFLKKKGYHAKGYAGFVMTFPYIADVLNKAQQDGVSELIVFYQGAQYSQVTSQIVLRETKKYLAKHPEWVVRAIGMRSFSDDKRFTDLVNQSIRNRVTTTFSGVDDRDICLLLPLHGNIMYWLDRGDPYYSQVMRNVSTIKEHFPHMNVSYGFQNHNEIPFIEWTQPEISASLAKVAKAPCSHALINGRVSFTVDSLETLFDQSLQQKNAIENLSLTTGSQKTVVVEKMFNIEPDFAALMADLAVEALSEQGDIEVMRP